MMSIKRLREAILKNISLHRMNWKKEALRSRPVSYTHLDVYKRQPFNGPIAGVKVGRVNGELICNPTVEQAAASDIDLTVAGTSQALNMVEAGAKEVSEEDMLQALMFGHEQIKKLCAFQEEIVKACGKEKREVTLYAVDEALDKEVRENFEAKIREAVSIKEKLERYGKIDELTEEAVETVSYTHLDVYKRQGGDTAGSKGRS